MDNLLWHNMTFATNVNAHTVGLSGTSSSRMSWVFAQTNQKHGAIAPCRMEKSLTDSKLRSPAKSPPHLVLSAPLS
jgi:hypothetical protein